MFDFISPLRPTGQTDVEYALDQAELEDYRQEVPYLEARLKEVEEDLLKISDAFDNIGWSPLSEMEAKEIDLATVKKMSAVSRSLTAINPFVKRGVNSRISYIWGKGVGFDHVDKIQEVIDKNRKRVFSPQGYEEFERALATDGNVFTLVPVDPKKKTMYRIPLEQITGIVVNPEDNEDVWYYKREYTYKETLTTGVVKTVDKIVYYPSISYLATKPTLRSRFLGGSVDKDYAIQHSAVNKQIGWRWGLPDVAPVVFWAKAYKEYLEDNAKLVKAYGNLAYKVNAANQNAGQMAAASIRGMSDEVGGTAVGSPSASLVPLPATGSSVDFSKGQPLASAIAAGLEVSLMVITSDPGTGNRSAAESLDLPTLKAMEARQNLHMERFLELFEFWGLKVSPVSTSDSEIEVSEDKKDEKAKAKYAVVTFPAIESDSTKDRVAAVTLAYEAKAIFQEEMRKEILEELGIAPWKPWNVVPEIESPVIPGQQEGGVTPGQGKSGGVAAKGGNLTSNNEARDNREKDSNNS